MAANHREIEANIFTEIPEWCPLDDVPQGKCDFCGGGGKAIEIGDKNAKPK